jgi:hypothetical protein
VRCERLDGALAGHKRRGGKANKGNLHSACTVVSVVPMTPRVQERPLLHDSASLSAAPAHGSIPSSMQQTCHKSVMGLHGVKHEWHVLNEGLLLLCTADIYIALLLLYDVNPC